jgi:hypothetical protein
MISRSLNAVIQMDIRHANLLQLTKLNHMKRVSIPQLCVLVYYQRRVQSCSQLQAKKYITKKAHLRNLACT